MIRPKVVQVKNTFDAFFRWVSITINYVLSVETKNRNPYARSVIILSYSALFKNGWLMNIHLLFFDHYPIVNFARYRRVKWKERLINEFRFHHLRQFSSIFEGWSCLWDFSWWIEFKWALHAELWNINELKYFYLMKIWVWEHLTGWIGQSRLNYRTPSHSSLETSSERTTLRAPRCSAAWRTKNLTLYT